MEDIVSSASAVPIPVAQPSAVRDSERWTHGDFALISSDHIRFRIPAFYMFAASSVFRDMHDLGHGENIVIQLDDGECETAAIIDLFLKFVIDNKAWETPPQGLQDMLPWLHLLDFLDKWDCSAAYETLILHAMHRVCHGQMFDIWAFLLGAHADDADLCALALKTEAARSVWKHTPEQVKSQVAGRRCTDPTAMSLELWHLIPPDYGWALAQAWGHHMVTATAVAATDRFPCPCPAHNIMTRWVDLSGEFRWRLASIKARQVEAQPAPASGQGAL